MADVDYDKLDPGICTLVRRLNAHGFETTDSGDGVTKIAAGWEPYKEALPYRHVVCVVSDPARLLSEADRLLDMLGGGWIVEATYTPSLFLDGSTSLLMVRGIESNHLD